MSFMRKNKAWKGVREGRRPGLFLCIRASEPASLARCPWRLRKEEPDGVRKIGEEM